MNTRRLVLVRRSQELGGVWYNIIFDEHRSMWIAGDSRGAGVTFEDPSLPHLLARIAAVIAVSDGWSPDAPPTIEDVREDIRQAVRRARLRFSDSDVAALTDQTLRELGVIR